MERLKEEKGRERRGKRLPSVPADTTLPLHHGIVLLLTQLQIVYLFISVINTKNRQLNLLTVTISQIMTKSKLNRPKPDVSASSCQ